MSSAETADAEQAVELIDASASDSVADVGVGVTSSDDIAPLLTKSEKPKINIFSVSYSLGKPREPVTETEIAPLSLFILWVWNGLDPDIWDYYAILLSFITPIIASIAARFILHEKLKISDIGGLACSFVGVLFISRQILTTQGRLVKTGEASIFNVTGSHHIFAALVGLFLSIAGGISYCLIKAGSKASDQPVVTLFSFGILASPAVGLCTFSFEDFQLPSLYSFLLMLVVGGVLAAFAQALI